MSRSLIVSSAKVVLYINAQPYGRVTSFGWNSQTQRRAIHGVDSLEPYELAPQVTRVTGQVGVLRTIGDGGLEGPGIVAALPKLPREKYFSVVLVERMTDAVIFKADQCSVVGQEWRADVRGIVAGTFQFESITWENEAATSR